MALDLLEAHLKKPIKPKRNLKKRSSLSPWETGIAEGKISEGHGESAKKKKTRSVENVNEPLTNRERSVNEPLTNRERSVNEIETRSVENVNEPLTNRERSVNEPLTNRERSVNEESIKFSYNSLTELELRIGLYLIEHHYPDQSYNTNRVNTQDMAFTLGSNKASLRVLVLRMRNKGCFKMVTSKKYYRKFMFSEEFFYYLKTLKKIPNVNEPLTNRERSVNEPLTNRERTVNSSVNEASSSIRVLSYRKPNTTHGDKKPLELQDELEWSTIQTPEILKKIGFGKSHIDQFKNKFGFTPEEISKFLEAYAHDLENGELEKLKSRKINLIGYFFGALKRGGYSPSTEGFKTSEEIGQEEMLARLEKRKKEREERKQKLEGLLFEEWLETKTDEELIAISKPSLKIKDMFHLAVLKDHFLKNEMVKFQKGFRQ